MRVSAKADYAVRAAVELAAAGEGEPVKGERLATSQDIPLQFLEHILLELKHQGLPRPRRGPGAATGSPGPPPRSPSPTSSARSRARSPTSSRCRRRRSNTRAT